jgi:hypothetical protein
MGSEGQCNMCFRFSQNKQLLRAMSNLLKTHLYYEDVKTYQSLWGKDIVIQLEQNQLRQRVSRGE